MRLRKAYLPFIALLGTATALLPGLAASETTPTVNAVAAGPGGTYGYETFAWSPSQVAIGAGGAVSFSTGTTNEPHGIIWTGGPATPACGSSVPVGENNGKEHWSGSCTFSQAGEYSFRCSVHREMTGRIVVSATGATTTTMTTPAGTTTTTGVGTTTGAGPTAAPALGAVTLPAVQRGTRVHGSASVGAAGSRLEIDLSAAQASLAKAKRREVSVGRAVMASVGPGKVSFSVTLSAKARRTLRHKGRLVVGVAIKLTPPGGTPTTLTRQVTLHG